MNASGATEQLQRVSANIRGQIWPPTKEGCLSKSKPSSAWLATKIYHFHICDKIAADSACATNSQAAEEGKK